ncbi:MAG TPA: glycine cleavage T C-terminal barrel domain-containing protein [Acidimicrobiales bacterium]|nr:glycine cleavage T C-terminal barrel domain-containing protein [Acidimicrobiales bacterium]
MRIEPFWVEVPRDVVRVSGPDAVSFLQGQISQDVVDLAVGASAWSFVLQPQGKVDAWFRATRSGADEIVLDVDGGFGAALVGRLERFKLRTKADLEVLDGWRCLAVRGAAGDGADPGWPGVEGFDLLGPDPEAPAGLAEADLGRYEALRIECGVPAMGRELTERTIPAEAGGWIIERSVSFTKGCYTGQELVARIDSRGGNVPRHLRGLILDGDDVPDPGAPVVIEGAEVGAVTSAARSPRLEAVVALAYVKRDVVVPTGGEVGGRVARIEALPLLRS